MSFDGFLNHSCDIYHMVRTDKSPGYALPASPSFSYSEAPDVAAVPCHFGTKGGAMTVKRTEPQTKLEARIKLALPVGTDVRVNDKIVDCDTCYEYTAEIPQNIRGHHITVFVCRTEQQEPL